MWERECEYVGERECVRECGRESVGESVCGRECVWERVCGRVRENVGESERVGG